MHRFFNLIVPRTRLNKSLRILVTINAALVFVMGMFGPFYAVFVEPRPRHYQIKKSVHHQFLFYHSAHP